MDDFKNLNAKTKFVFQILLISIIVIFFDIQVQSLGYFFGFSVPLNLGFLAIPFSIIGVVGLMNAFNMIDGADGHAGLDGGRDDPADARRAGAVPFGWGINATNFELINHHYLFNSGFLFSQRIRTRFR